MLPNPGVGHHPHDAKKEVFDVADLKANEPFGQFYHWFEEAFKLLGYREAHAVALATATKEGIPSARMVLMQKFDKHGIIICTDYGSRKAKELEENPHCSLVFFWKPMERSVRIEGTAERLPAAESETYFSFCSRECQIKTQIGHQSSVIPDRESLDKKKRELTLKYSDTSKSIPKPENWGGYRIIPTVFEFWYGHEDWTSDRLRFRKPKSGEVINKAHTMEVDDGWLLERLAP